MTQLFNDVKITGVADVPQLTILANATQVTNPIQVWQDSAGNPLLRVSGDGRLQIGNNIALGSADALINANYNPSGAQPTSAWHAAGVLNVPTSLAGTVNWVYHELQLTGAGTVNGVQNGLYAKLTNSTNGNAGTADLRAATFQAISSGGGTALPVGKATGVRAIASNAVTGGSAYLSQAIGVEATISNDVGGSITAATAFSVAAPSNGGTIGTLYGLKMPDLTQGSANYALYTGKGIVHVGDVLETPVLASTPTSTPPANFVQLYTKLLAGAPQLYAKNSSGTEYLVGGGGGGGAPTTSKYLLQVADGSLPNAQAMGTLSTGLVKNTTTTGVQSIAATGTDYTSPTGTENLSNKTISASPIDSSVIGGVTPAAITGTTVKANGILTTGSGQVVQERVVTAAGAVTVATTDYMITVNKTVGAATTVNLPASPTTGQTFVIHDGKGDASSNFIVIVPNAGNINNQANLSLTIAYSSAIVTYNGTQWDAVIASSLQTPSYPLCQGRLTPTSGTPVLSADVTGAGTLYWTPYNGNQIGLYNGTSWDMVQFAETSLSLAGIVSNTIVDIFAYNNSGTLALEGWAWNGPTAGGLVTPGVSNTSPPVLTSTAHGLVVDQIVTINYVIGAVGINGPAWRVSAVTANTFTLTKLDGTAITAPGVWTSGGQWIKQDQTTLTRFFPLVFQNGILCKSGQLTRRYLGTIRIQPDASGLGGKTESSQLRRFIYNHYNQVNLQSYLTDATYHSYSAGAWRVFNNNLVNRAEFVLGDLTTVLASLEGQATTAASLGSSVYEGIGLDSTTNNPGIFNLLNTPTAVAFSGALSATGNNLFAAGYHYLSAQEYIIGGSGAFYLFTIFGQYLG